MLTRMHLRVVFLSAARRRIFATSTFLASRKPCHWVQYISTRFEKSIAGFVHHEFIWVSLLMWQSAVEFAALLSLGDVAGCVGVVAILPLLYTHFLLYIVMHCFRNVRQWALVALHANSHPAALQVPHF